jgi:hypothetical protein
VHPERGTRAEPAEGLLYKLSILSLSKYEPSGISFSVIPLKKGIQFFFNAFLKGPGFLLVGRNDRKKQ